MIFLFFSFRLYDQSSSSDEVGGHLQVLQAWWSGVADGHCAIRSGWCLLHLWRTCLVVWSSSPQGHVAEGTIFYNDHWWCDHLWEHLHVCLYYNVIQSLQTHNIHICVFKWKIEIRILFSFLFVFFWCLQLWIHHQISFFLNTRM